MLLVPMTEALARLRERDVRLHVLAPPYRALGCGAMRVVRARDVGATLELDVAYEHFEKVGHERD